MNVELFKICPKVFELFKFGLLGLELDRVVFMGLVFMFDVEDWLVVL